LRVLLVPAARPGKQSRTELFFKEHRTRRITATKAAANGIVWLLFPAEETAS
jgi:hypothetical protein